MNDYEKVINIYEVLINGGELTQTKIINMGINEEELSCYLAMGLLTKQESNYKLLSTNGLYEYGVELQKNAHYGKATKCFKFCLKSNENDYDAYLQLLNSNLNSGNYTEVYDLISVSKSSLVNKIHDNNLHLLLLAGIKPFNDETIVSHVEGLRNEDIMVVGDVPTTDKQNEIRNAIINKKFAYALELLNNRRDYSVENAILKTMLIKNIETYEFRKKKIKDLVCGCNYSDLINYLSKLERCPRLNTIETATLFLARKLIKFDEKEIVLNEIKPYNLFQAIYTGKYKQALLLSKEYNEKKGIKEEDNPIYLLLLDLVRLIECNDKENKQKEKIISGEIIFKHLHDNDFESFEKELKNYLKDINKSNYETFILDLVKVSCLKEDDNYEEPIKMLNSLKNDLFKLEVSEYVHKFFLAISNKNFDEAQLYLDIIAKTRALGEECDIYPYLSTTLSKYVGLDKKTKKI